MTGDPLDRIAERPVAQIPYSRDGTYVALTLVEREALVEVARAAREFLDERAHDTRLREALARLDGES